jgi:hypothetical protein
MEDHPEEAEVPVTFGEVDQIYKTYIAMYGDPEAEDQDLHNPTAKGSKAAMAAVTQAAAVGGGKGAPTKGTSSQKPPLTDYELQRERNMAKLHKELSFLKNGMLSAVANLRANLTQKKTQARREPRPKRRILSPKRNNQRKGRRYVTTCMTTI